MATLIVLALNTTAMTVRIRLMADCDIRGSARSPYRVVDIRKVPLV